MSCIFNLLATKILHYDKLNSKHIKLLTLFNKNNNDIPSDLSLLTVVYKESSLIVESTLVTSPAGNSSS